MTRDQFDLLCSAPVWCVMAAVLALGSAQGAPAKIHDVHCLPNTAWTGCITQPLLPPASPIRIQCPCDLHVRQQDGVITLSGAGTITVGPKTTDYTGGHWESNAPVSFDNHAPEPKTDDRR